MYTAKTVSRCAASLVGLCLLSGCQPDFAPPRHILEAGEKAARDGPHGYTSPVGIPALREAVAAFAAQHAPVVLARLSLDHHAGFVAFRPMGDVSDLNALASACVRRLDALRAPLTDAEIARRRKTGLSARQDAQMLLREFEPVLVPGHEDGFRAGGRDLVGRCPPDSRRCTRHDDDPIPHTKRPGAAEAMAATDWASRAGPLV